MCKSIRTRSCFFFPLKLGFDACSSKPFPIEPNEFIEDHQLSFRAIVVGCALGAVVGSSNIYLGLKTGFTFGSQLFGAIFGYVVLKAMSNTLPESGLLGWLGGGPFGPKENCTVQSLVTNRL